jgi:hypothetical protein
VCQNGRSVVSTKHLATRSIPDMSVTVRPLMPSGPYRSTIYPWQFVWAEIERKPKSLGAFRFMKSKTFRCVLGFSVPTKTFARGSMNQRLSCPRIAGGTSLATRTVTVRMLVVGDEAPGAHLL